jgi:hypothetical protein
MTVQWTDVNGLDFTLPNAPPLLEPPLSLFDEARILISTENLVARRQAAVEARASAAEQLEADTQDIANNQGDSLQDTSMALRQQIAEWDAVIGDLDTDLKLLQEWEHGFQWLPELPKGAMAGFTIDTAPAISNPTQGALKLEGNNQTPWGWYDPFIIYTLDERSAFGLPPGTSLAERAARAQRALLAHEPYGAENEFWTGTLVPTNFHLSASPSSPQTSPHRTLAFPFPLPTPTPGTTLGVPESLSDSLASLDQAIANANAGQGLVHATPYVVQKWAQVYPYLKDAQGNLRTVNGNILVPGYGYPGTGPDAEDRSITDGVTATDFTFTSATAAFTDSDIGRHIDAPGVPAGAVILSVTSATAVDLSEATTASATGVHATIDGTGGDSTGAVLQWAYATDMVFHNKGDIHLLPAQLREMSPDLTVNDDMPVRAERTHALFTNYLLRAAVLVDTGTP